MFDDYLRGQGDQAMWGKIIDASVVPGPKQHNSRDENAKIKDGGAPEGWANEPAKRSQKDTDARWGRKLGKSYFGYKACPRLDRGTMSMWTAGTSWCATTR